MEKSKEAFKEFVSADFPFRTPRALQQNLPAREKLLQPTNPSKVDNYLFCVSFHCKRDLFCHDAEEKK